ncbi:MAG: hypothetical protein PHW27_08785 [Melioribacteraceae bacterium]|nr:hypothetical protein [Melioribacteraceae bacterium]
MNFLDQFALPQSSGHIQLLEYVMILTMLLLIPYLALFLGSTFFSVLYNKKGRKEKNTTYIKFSKDVIDLVTVNKSSALALGAIPMLSMMFCYSQLMQSSGGSVSGNIFFSFLIYIASVIAIFTFKYSFHLSDIFNLTKLNGERDDSIQSEFDTLKKTTNKVLIKSGSYGLIFLFISVYVFIGSVQFATDSTRWAEGESILSILFSIQTITGFLHFIAISFSITAIKILYVFFKPGGKYSGKENDYTIFARNFALKTAMLFILVQPVLYAVNILLLPKNALNWSYFGIAVFVLFILLVLANLLYFMLKESNVKYRSSTMFLTLIMVTLFIVKDQTAFNTTSQLHTKKLAKEYDLFAQNFKEELGLFKVEVNGEEIYNGRCIACHNFDTKLVGPPYNSVLPKYENNIDGLAEFILNPQKIDPAYPAMPNQGLKPNEARAVAEFIMTTYQSSK